MQQEKSQNSPFQGYTVKELRLLARQYKIKYYYKFKKLDLILAITTNTQKNSNTIILSNNTNSKKITKTNTKTVKELRIIAKSLKIKYYYKLKKLDLVNAIQKNCNTQKNVNKLELDDDF